MLRISKYIGEVTDKMWQQRKPKYQSMVNICIYQETKQSNNLGSDLTEKRKYDTEIRRQFR